MDKGYVQVYTGNGKGKTTAALGLAVRAACAGKNVFIGQFLKGMEYSELKLPEYFDNITMKQYGTEYFITKDPNEIDTAKANIGFENVVEIIKSAKYDVVILDEINIAMMMKLVDVNELIKVLSNRKESMEVIITGRGAPDEIIEYADLVTEMKEIKHYYNKGVQARVGIEK